MELWAPRSAKNWRISYARCVFRFLSIGSSNNCFILLLWEFHSGRTVEHCLLANSATGCADGSNCEICAFWHASLLVCFPRRLKADFCACFPAFPVRLVVQKPAFSSRKYACTVIFGRFSAKSRGMWKSLRIVEENYLSERPKRRSLGIFQQKPKEFSIFDMSVGLFDRACTETLKLASFFIRSASQPIMLIWYALMIQGIYSPFVHLQRPLCVFARRRNVLCQSTIYKQHGLLNFVVFSTCV